MNFKTLFLAILLSCVFALPAVAIDYISYVGAEIDTGAASNWLTESFSKTMSADGNNVYATLGGVHFGVDRVDIATTWGSSAGQSRDAAYALIDDIKNPATDSAAGIVLSDDGGFTLKFLRNYDRIRIGVMWDVLGTATPAGTAATDQVIYIRNALNTSMNSGNIYTSVENANPDIYFFDLVNVKANDYFSAISVNYNGAYRVTSENIDFGAYLGPVMIDFVPFTSTDNFHWELNFTDSGAANYLDTSLMRPSRALVNTDGTMTSAVARLEGAAAGSYNALAMTGLNKDAVHKLSYIENGVERYKLLLANEKGELSIPIGYTGTSPVALNADFLANVASLSVDNMKGNPTQVFSVDIQGSSGNVMSGPAGLDGMGGVWNAYNVTDWKGSTAATIAGGLQSGYSMPLVDSEGNDTGITFATSETADVVGYNGGPDALFHDYLLSGMKGALVTTAPLAWEIGGLKAGDLYELVMFAGGHPAYLTVFDEINGDEMQTIAGGGESHFFVYADDLGKILGTFGKEFTTDSEEYNWAGFHLVNYGGVFSSNVPEPSTWLMMAMAVSLGGVMVWRKKSRGGR